MTALTNQKIQTSYQDLIQVSNSGLGIDATLRAVSSGLGIASPLQLSTTAVNIQGTFKVNGVTLAFGSNAITWITSAPTTITLPTSGTMATLAGAETFTNKTITAPIIATISNTGTLTLPTSTDTLIGKATTDILTNKTYDTAGTGNIFKINGTTVNAVTGTGNVVLATSPSLTTPALGVVASGNISACTSTSMVLTTPVLGVATATSLAFSGAPKLIGATTNTSASAGSVGEVISSYIVDASAVSLTSTVAKTVTSITLTAGNWNIFGNVYITSAGTAMTVGIGAISTTTNTFPDNSLLARVDQSASNMNALGLTVPCQTVSIASSTTYYLVGYSVFSASTCKASGNLYAIRTC